MREWDDLLWMENEVFQKVVWARLRSTTPSMSLRKAVSENPNSISYGKRELQSIGGLFHNTLTNIGWHKGVLETAPERRYPHSFFSGLSLPGSAGQRGVPTAWRV